MCYIKTLLHSPVLPEKLISKAIRVAKQGGHLLWEGGGLADTADHRQGVRARSGRGQLRGGVDIEAGDCLHLRRLRK